MYADDLQIYHSHVLRVYWGVEEVNSDMRKILEVESCVIEWCYGHMGHLLGPIPAHFLGDVVIPCLDKAKNLGVTCNYVPSCGNNVTALCRSLCGLRLAKETGCLLFAVRFVAFVISFLIYCDFVYFPLDSFSLRKLTMTFNACVYRRRLFDLISDVSDSILG
jgi:hypothetical protein